MNKTIRFLALAAILQLFAFSAIPADAATQASLASARAIAAACPGAWESPACLTAVSQSNYAMVSNYAAILQQKKLEGPAETLKQHCAASTAHREQVYPAKAMKSAFVECANAISDLVDQIQVTPDLDHYQLLLVPVLCMNKDKSCPGLEKGLKQYLLQ